MGERGPQTRGPREIADFVGWEMLGREMGCLGAEDPSAIRNQSSRGRGNRDDGRFGGQVP